MDGTTPGGLIPGAGIPAGILAGTTIGIGEDGRPNQEEVVISTPPAA